MCNTADLTVVFQQIRDEYFVDCDGAKTKGVHMEHACCILQQDRKNKL
jgi:hypothetical protein